MPLPHFGARNVATDKFFLKERTGIGRLRLINKNIRYISRFIVDPRFQKLGIGTKLLTETLKRQSVPLVETQTPLDFTNKIFQKAGFHLHYTKTPTNYVRFLEVLQTIGLNEQATSCPPAVHHRISALSSEKRDWFEKEIVQFTNPFRHRKNMPHCLERTVYLCSKLPYPKAYLIWQNPDVPRYNEQ